MKLSIITINLNNCEGLRRTMESVFNQTYKDFEYIVVDGASTDGSVGVIGELEVKVPNDINFHWISEPDTGIYNAMNKGLRMAKGEYILMLNSGDYLMDESVTKSIMPHLINGVDIIQGNVLNFKNGNWVTNRGYGRSDLTFRDVYKGFFLHQASFIRMAVYEKYGMYDETWKIGGDTVFFLKALGFGEATFKYVDICISIMEPNGISSLPSEKWKRIRIEEDKRYDGLLPTRLLEMCVKEEKKVNLYDELHQNRWIWKTVLLLDWLSKLLNKRNNN